MERIVGVDVAKARLDAFCLERRQHRSFDHDARGIAGLAAWLAPQPGRDGSVRRLRAAAARGSGRARGRGRDRRRQARARLRQGERPAGRDRPARCRGDRQVRRLRPPGAHPGPGGRAPAASSRPTTASSWPRSPPAASSSATSRTPALVERARAALDRLRREKAELDALLAEAVAADPDSRPPPPCCAPRRGSGRSWSRRSWPSCGTRTRPARDRQPGRAGAGRQGQRERRGRREIEGGRGPVRCALHMAVLSASRGSRARRRLPRAGRSREAGQGRARRGRAQALVTLDAMLRHRTPWRGDGARVAASAPPARPAAAGPAVAGGGGPGERRGPAVEGARRRRRRPRPSTGRVPPLDAGVRAAVAAC